MSDHKDFHMPASWYEPPNELEHDDDCELLDEDTLADETITECKCEERYQARLEEGPDPDEGRDDG